MRLLVAPRRRVGRLRRLLGTNRAGRTRAIARALGAVVEVPIVRRVRRLGVVTIGTRVRRQQAEDVRRLDAAMTGMTVPLVRPLDAVTTAMTVRLPVRHLGGVMMRVAVPNARRIVAGRPPGVEVTVRRSRSGPITAVARIALPTHGRTQAVVVETARTSVPVRRATGVMIVRRSALGHVRLAGMKAAVGEIAPTVRPVRAKAAVEVVIARIGPLVRGIVANAAAKIVRIVPVRRAAASPSVVAVAIAAEIAPTAARAAAAAPAVPAVGRNGLVVAVAVTKVVVEGAAMTVRPLSPAGPAKASK